MHMHTHTHTHMRQLKHANTQRSATGTKTTREYLATSTCRLSWCVLAGHARFACACVYLHAHASSQHRSFPPPFETTTPPSHILLSIPSPTLHALTFFSRTASHLESINPIGPHDPARLPSDAPRPPEEGGADVGLDMGRLPRHRFHLHGSRGRLACAGVCVCVCVCSGVCVSVCLCRCICVCLLFYICVYMSWVSVCVIVRAHRAE